MKAGPRLVAAGLISGRIAHNRTARYHSLIDLWFVIGAFALGLILRGKKGSPLFLMSSLFLLPHTHTLGGSVAMATLLFAFFASIFFSFVHNKFTRNNVVSHKNAVSHKFEHHEFANFKEEPWAFLNYFFKWGLLPSLLSCLESGDGAAKAVLWEYVPQYVNWYLPLSKNAWMPARAQLDMCVVDIIETDQWTNAPFQLLKKTAFHLEGDRSGYLVLSKRCGETHSLILFQYEALAKYFTK